MNHSWEEITRENVESAIARFTSENPSYPEPKAYYLLYNDKKLPAKHIRGMAYEEAFGETLSKSEYSGGLDTKQFFERLGFTVERFDTDIDKPQKYDSWTLINDKLAVKKCDRSFFIHRSSGVSREITWFFGAGKLAEGEKVNIKLIIDEHSYDATVSLHKREGLSSISQLAWKTDLGNHFNKFMPGEGEDYPEAEFEKVDDNAFVVNIIPSKSVPTAINYLGVLDYLDKYSESAYGDPNGMGITPEEKEKYTEIRSEAQRAVEEMKKMVSLCEKRYRLKNTRTIKWLDGSNTKVRRYLWAQLKKSDHMEDLFSISIFADRSADTGKARYRISLELQNDKKNAKIDAQYHSHLDIPIAADSKLVYLAGSNEKGDPYIIPDGTEEAKKKLAEGVYDKIQISRIIDRTDTISNDDIESAMLEGISALLPYYEHVLSGVEQEWWPSKEEYDPGLTTDQWIDILNDPSITTDNNRRMLSMMLDYGKPAACSVVAEYYGEPKNYINRGSSAYAKKVADSTGCPLPSDQINENAKYWPVLYVGRRPAKGEQGSYIWKLRDELKEALEQIDLPVVTETEKMSVNTKYGVNTILYGPPGTGKTYNTARIAVAICEPDISVDDMEYSEILEKYNTLKDEGRIEFVTFHQSYGYEEFIEGIKPSMDNETGGSDIAYKIEDGLFKKFCKRAAGVKISTAGVPVQKTNPRTWCIMLDGTGKSKLKTYCFENSEIRIGWPSLPEQITEETEISTSNSRSMLYYFQDEMEIGDIVVVQKVNDNIDAIGIITGDYEYDNEVFTDQWPRKRKVKWLAKEIDENLFELNGGKHLGRLSIYPLDRVSADDIIRLANNNSSEEAVTIEQDEKPYVFIIDEINRGNISKIFGELITLIEDSKRSGADEPMETILPYSGEPFSVPNNVYILGTMNTADRSIAIMDTALRRRFNFEEMMPNPDVIRGITIEADGEKLDVARMLEVINERIMFLYDREHTIGHAFFTKLQKTPTLKMLAEIFSSKVIPLLQEYFYEDYAKIQLVLGDNVKSDPSYKFILDEPVKVKDIFKGSPEDIIDLPETRYSIHKEAFMNIHSYIEIM